MYEKNKYIVYCLDEYKKRKTVTIMAANKVAAKENALKNHPRYGIKSILSQEELKEIQIK